MKSPFCEHCSSFSFTEDGGKNIRCLLCVETRLKARIAELETRLTAAEESLIVAERGEQNAITREEVAEGERDAFDRLCVNRFGQIKDLTTERDVALDSSARVYANARGFVRRISELEEQRDGLRRALVTLANEASGFVAMADRASHGNTNIACMQMRIAKSRALAAVPAPQFSCPVCDDGTSHPEPSSLPPSDCPNCGLPQTAAVPAPLSPTVEETRDIGAALKRAGEPHAAGCWATCLAIPAALRTCDCGKQEAIRLVDAMRSPAGDIAAVPAPAPVDDTAKEKAKTETRGYHARRLSPECSNPREAAFAGQWEREHQYSDLLAELICLEPSRKVNTFNLGMEKVRDVSDIERRAAATVVQWLGSNVGLSFLESALSRVGHKIQYPHQRGTAPVDAIRELCSDCPPAGYPTDKTRCDGCLLAINTITTEKE